jgi:hypothetical protein
MPGPIFVGGSGRSGTTVFAHLLARDPGVSLVPIELRVHSDPGGLADAVAGRVPLGWLLERLRGYWKDRVSADGEPRGLTRFLSEPEYDAAVERFAAEFPADRAGAARRFVESLTASETPAWVEMSPPNCAAAGGLARMFPEARFVHVLRSGLDVACSYRRQPWAPDDLLDCLSLWADRTAGSAAGLAQLPPGASETVRFEDLVARGTLRPDRAHVGRWRTDIPENRQPVALALYLSLCDELDPADAGEARETWASLPSAVRARAALAARAHAAGWRLSGRRRWRWRPGRQLRATVA